MRILLLGKNGQVGWELQRSLAPLGEIVAPDRDGDPRGDLAEPDGLRATVRLVAPDVIVNAAAYTAVDRAESEPATAEAVNAIAPGVLAEEAARLGAWLVHYSTDYVFDGSGAAPWAEESETGPLNVYGRTKLAGEQAIRSIGCLHLILRTCWVYGARGGNFAKTILRLAAERESLTVVDDQFGAPTRADLIADVTAHAMRTALAYPALSGTYHLAATGETSWHGYAVHLVDQARLRGADIKAKPEGIIPVPSAAYPTRARRPANSRMATDKLRTAFGLSLPQWQHGVDRLLDELLAN